MPCTRAVSTAAYCGRPEVGAAWGGGAGEPLLDEGTWVVLDRFVDSSLAYQGAGRGLGIEPVRAINDFGTGGLTPDRTLSLRLDPALARMRSHGRTGPLDRLEREADEFFERIAAA